MKSRSFILVFSLFLTALITPTSLIASPNCPDLLVEKTQASSDRSSRSKPPEPNSLEATFVRISQIIPVMLAGPNYWRNNSRKFIEALKLALEIAEIREVFAGVSLIQRSTKTLDKFYDDSLTFIAKWSPKSLALFATELGPISSKYAILYKPNANKLKTVLRVLDKAQKAKVTEAQRVSLLMSQAFVASTLIPSDRKALDQEITYLEKLSTSTKVLQGPELSSGYEDYYAAYQIIVLQALTASATSKSIKNTSRSIGLLLGFDRPLGQEIEAVAPHAGQDLALTLDFVTENKSKFPPASVEKLKASLEMVVPPLVYIEILLRRRAQEGVPNTYSFLAESIERISQPELKASVYMKIFSEANLRHFGQADQSSLLVGQSFALTEEDLQRVRREFPALALKSDPSQMAVRVAYFISKYEQNSNSDALDSLAQMLMESSGFLLKLSSSLDPRNATLPHGDLPYQVSTVGLEHLIRFFNQLPVEISKKALINQVGALGPDIDASMALKSLQQENLLFLPLLDALISLGRDFGASIEASIEVSQRPDISTHRNFGLDVKKLIEFLRASKILDDYSEYFGFVKPN